MANEPGAAEVRDVAGAVGNDFPEANATLGIPDESKRVLAVGLVVQEDESRLLTKTRRQ